MQRPHLASRNARSRDVACCRRRNSSDVIQHSPAAHETTLPEHARRQHAFPERNATASPHQNEGHSTADMVQRFHVALEPHIKSLHTATMPQNPTMKIAHRTRISAHVGIVHSTHRYIGASALFRPPVPNSLNDVHAHNVVQPFQRSLNPSYSTVPRLICTFLCSYGPHAATAVVSRSQDSPVCRHLSEDSQ